MTGPAQVLQALRDRAWTLAAAESLTGGLLLATLTAVPGASDVVRGGFVVYATDLKQRLTGVPAELLDRVGAVHPQVALQLAGGARTGCGADVGIGLTGVAGPAEQDGHPVGTVYLAAVGPFGETVRKLAPPAVPDRGAIRAAAVSAALELLLLGTRAGSPTADGASGGPVGAAE